MVFNKKGISPVVATALLLVVAVIAVVGFQTWFQTFQSSQQSDVEQKANAGSAVTIDFLENSVVYLKSSALEAINNVSVRVLSANGTEMCAYIGDVTPLSLAPQAVTPVNLTNGTPGNNCGLIRNAQYTVVVVTPDGVYNEIEMARTGN